MLEYLWGDTMQIIFHVDLNAFYASAEMSIDPSLEGKPLVISGNDRRSIVSTASYEARKYGIHSAMPLFKAKELCQDLIIRPVNFDLYKKLSNEFFELVATYSSILEVASIDECYVDLTQYVIEHHIHPYELAKQIQNKVYQVLNLKCSIGIAPNKFLAKMASDMKKPMGVTILNKKNFQQILWPLDVSEMFGIGKKTYPKLKEAGINTIGDVANYKNYHKLRTIVGKNALLLYRKANGIDNSKLNVNKNQLKSVGNSLTLQYDTSDIDTLYDILKKLSQKVSYRAKRRNLISNTISITIKYTRFESISRQTIIDQYINDYETILSNAKYLFDNHYDGRPVRLLGVCLNNTIDIHDHPVQINLFQQDVKEKELSSAQKIISEINKTTHSHLKTASDLLNDRVQKKYLDKDS